MTSNQLSEARLNDLIKSNEAPSDVETSKLRDQIVATQMDLKSLDEEIKKTRAILDGLIKRSEDQQRVFISLKPTVSAIRRLPYEIVSRILIFCHEISGVAPIGVGPRFLHPLLLGQVCSSWRAVSHSTPTLWCSFSVHLSLEVSKGAQELMRQWSSRAYPLPLDVHISCHSISNIRFDPPFTDRIRKLKLNAVFAYVERILSCSWPLIEELDLEILNLQNDHTHRSITTISFDESPHLHSVILHSSAFLQVLTLPWQQLTSLELNYAHPVDDLLRLLSIATNLKKFSYRARSTEIQGSSSPAPNIIHHNLRDLSLIIQNYRGATGSPCMSFLFQHLTLPSLRSATMGKCGPAELATFAEFQARSQFTLEAMDFTITCWYRGFAEQDAVVPLVRFLRGYPFLAKLRPSIDVDEDNYVRCLESLELRHYTFEDPGSGLLPCVEDMRLKCSQMVDGETIAGILKTRWLPGAGGALKRFGVDTMQGRGLHVRLRREVLEQLRTFEREGLIFDIDGIGLAYFESLYPVQP